jgi:hypothetical protein
VESIAEPSVAREFPDAPVLTHAAWGPSTAQTDSCESVCFAQDDNFAADNRAENLSRHPCLVFERLLNKRVPRGADNSTIIIENDLYRNIC